MFSANLDSNLPVHYTNEIVHILDDVACKEMQLYKVEKGIEMRAAEM